MSKKKHIKRFDKEKVFDGFLEIMKTLENEESVSKIAKVVIKAQGYLEDIYRQGYEEGLEIADKEFTINIKQ